MSPGFLSQHANWPGPDWSLDIMRYFADRFSLIIEWYYLVPLTLIIAIFFTRVLINFIRKTGRG